MRPLTLDVSALSDSEYTLYTTTLEVFCDTEEELRGERETESEYYERLSFSIRQVRAWVRSKYTRISTKSIDAIFRLFSPKLKSSDTLTLGQLFAVLRLIVHADNGKDVDRHLVFVQGNLRKTPTPSPKPIRSPSFYPSSPTYRPRSHSRSLPTPALPSVRSRSGSTSSSMSLDSSPENNKPSMIINRLKTTPPPNDTPLNRPIVSATGSSSASRTIVSPDDNRTSRPLHRINLHPRDGSLTRHSASTTTTGSIRMPIPTTGYKVVEPNSSIEIKQEEDDTENPFKDYPSSWSYTPPRSPGQSWKRKADTQDRNLDFAVCKRVRRDEKEWFEMRRPLSKDEVESCLRDMRYSQSLDTSLN